MPLGGLTLNSTSAHLPPRCHHNHLTDTHHGCDLEGEHRPNRTDPDTERGAFIIIIIIIIISCTLSINTDSHPAECQCRLSAASATNSQFSRLDRAAALTVHKESTASTHTCTHKYTQSEYCY